jgi:hypothetical protein
MHGVLPVQHGIPIAPQVGAELQPRYCAIWAAQFAWTAALVALSSMVPAAVHFSFCAAHAKYVRKSAPHVGSFETMLHWSISDCVGAGSFGHAPFEVQLAADPPAPPEQARSVSQAPARTASKHR